MPYEEALLAVLSRPQARLRVVRRCLDLADLLGAASTGEARVAVVSPDLHRLDREAIARLAASGVVAYGVVTAGDDAGARLLVGLGVALGVPAHQPADGSY